MKEQHYLYGIGIALLVFGIVGILVVLAIFILVCIRRKHSRYTELGGM